MTIYGYARVSIDGSSIDSQLEALRAVGAERIFIDDTAGPIGSRPEFSRLLADLAGGDRVIVMRLDTLARSTRDLLEVVAAITARGATFKSLGEQWADTTVLPDPPMLTVFAGLAAFERDLIVARTRKRRALAKAQGRNLGRPSKLTTRQQTRDLADIASGKVSQADVARRRHVSESTISRLVAKSETGLKMRSQKPDPMTLQAAQVFLDRIQGRYVRALLYGSRARGDHAPDSDADIAVILNGPRGNRGDAVRELSDAAHHASLETGVYVQPFPLWESELKNPKHARNPALIENIKREGIPL